MSVKGTIHVATVAPFLLRNYCNRAVKIGPGSMTSSVAHSLQTKLHVSPYGFSRVVAAIFQYPISSVDVHGRARGRNFSELLQQ